MFLSGCFVSVLFLLCQLYTIFGVLLAGLPHFDSTACGHHFSCCRLHVCVSVAGKHSNSSSQLSDSLFSVYVQRSSEAVCH